MQELFTCKQSLSQVMRIRGKPLPWIPGTPWNLFASRMPIQKLNFLSVLHNAENWRLHLLTGPKTWSQFPNISSSVPLHRSVSSRVKWEGEHGAWGSVEVFLETMWFWWWWNSRELTTKVSYTRYYSSLAFIIKLCLQEGQTKLPSIPMVFTRHIYGFRRSSTSFMCKKY